VDAILRPGLHEYFRSAQATLPLVIYEVSCWLTMPADMSPVASTTSAAPDFGSRRPSEPPFMTIAFIQSVEFVGLPHSLATPSDPTRDANATLPATVSYTMADPWGVCYSSPSAISSRFSALSYHTYSTAPESDHSPSSGRLLMRHTIAADKGRSASSQARSPGRCVRDATVSVGGVGNAEATTPRGARGVTNPATLPTERFGIYVDGEYYGPFAYASITPCVAPGDSEPLVLPLRTFFPIEGTGE